MNIKKLMRCLLWGTFLLLIFSPVAYGDLYWESVQEQSGGPQGMPKGLPKDFMKNLPKNAPRPDMGHAAGGTETTKHYLTSYGSRVDTKDDITIILFDDMTIYQLDPSTKTYIKINMAEMEKSMGPMAKMQEDTEVTATGETKTIKGFKCEKYIMTIMGIENVQWLSKNVPGYDEYKKISSKIMKDSPQFRKMGLTGKLSGKGFPVRMESKVMGMSTTTTLRKIEKKTLDKDLFKVPAGYVQKPLNVPLHR
jgi:hypothetical protein